MKKYRNNILLTFSRFTASYFLQFWNPVKKLSNLYRNINWRIFSRLQRIILRIWNSVKKLNNQYINIILFTFLRIILRIWNSVKKLNNQYINIIPYTFSRFTANYFANLKSGKKLKNPYRNIVLYTVRGLSRIILRIWNPKKW